MAKVSQLLLEGVENLVLPLGFVADNICEVLHDAVARVVEQDKRPLLALTPVQNDSLIQVSQRFG